ncbi:MAG: SUMF1/EgtB/PvdO family nonheme iron enzyme [Cyanobacteria bacterium P01_C01_bin.89]
MDWSKTNKKKFRQALQGVYRTYSDLRIFAAEELDWRLEEIVPSSHTIKTASFDLIAWAEGRGKLQALYEAFQEENPDHPFLIKIKPESEGSKEKRATGVQTGAQINQDHKSSGDNVAGNKYVNHYHSASSQTAPPKTAIPETAPPEKPSLPGEAFTFTTASITLDGIITERQGQGRRQFFDLGGTPLEMVWMPAGSFLMGSPESEEGRSDGEGPQHRVTFREGFWMGRYPVTQAQWRWVACLGAVDQSLKANPSGFSGDKRPVERVSWDETQEFCRRLSREFSPIFNLPSEAQWEYACRGGTGTAFAFGDTLTTDLANYEGNYTYGAGPKGKYRKETTEVGQFPANEWELHDMHGNVWEWCEDMWHKNYNGALNNGTSWIDNKSTSRLLRGGSWFSFPRHCRSAFRYYYPHDYRLNYFGFRVVCSPVSSLAL